MGSLSLSSSSTDGDFVAALARLDAPNPCLSLDTTLFTPALALESASQYHGSPSTMLDHSNPTTSRSPPVLTLLGRLKKRASALRFAALGGGKNGSSKGVDGSDGAKDAHTPRLSLSILTTLGSSAHISRSKQPIAMGASTPCLPSQLHPHTATPSPLASSTSSGSVSSCGVHAYGSISSSSAASSPTKNGTIPTSPKPSSRWSTSPKPSSRWSTSSNGTNASYRAYPGPRRLDRPHPPSTPALSHPASSAGKVVQLALPNKHKPKPQTKPAPGTRPRHAGAIASAPVRPAPKASIPPAPRSQAHPYVYASANSESQARVSQRVQVQTSKHKRGHLYASRPRSPPRVVRAGAGVLSAGKPKLVVVLPEQKHQRKPLQNTSTHLSSPAPLPLLAPAHPLPFPPLQRERAREAPRTPPRSCTHPSPRSPYAFAYPGPRASLGSSPRARCSPRGFVYPASLPVQASPSSLSSGTSTSLSTSTNASGSDWSDPGMWLASSFEGYTLPSSPSPSSSSSGFATPDSPVVPGPQAFVPVRRVPRPYSPHTPLRKPTRPHLPVYAASGVGTGKRYSFGPALESSPIPSRPLGMEVQESPCSVMSDSTVWHSACSGSGF